MGSFIDGGGQIPHPVGQEVSFKQADPTANIANSPTPDATTAKPVNGDREPAHAPESITDGVQKAQYVAPTIVDADKFRASRLKHQTEGSFKNLRVTDGQVDRTIMPLSGLHTPGEVASPYGNHKGLSPDVADWYAKMPVGFGSSAKPWTSEEMDKALAYGKATRPAGGTMTKTQPDTQSFLERTLAQSGAPSRTSEPAPQLLADIKAFQNNQAAG